MSDPSDIEPNTPKPIKKKPLWPWLLLLVVTLVLIYAYSVWVWTIDYLFSGASDLFHAFEWVINFLDEQKNGQN